MVQSIVGTHLANTWHQLAAKPCYQFFVCWDGTTGDERNWVDETDHLLDWNVNSSLVDGMVGIPALGQVAPATLTVNLSNEDLRYTLENEDSPLYAWIAHGLQNMAVKFLAGYVYAAHIMTYYDAQGNVVPGPVPGGSEVEGEELETPEYTQQFVGYIESANPSQSSDAFTLSLTCDDNSTLIRQRKESTPIYPNTTAGDMIWRLLTAVGLAHELDWSRSLIPYAWLDDEPIFAQCQQLAASEGGWFYFTKDGLAKFESLTHWMEDQEHINFQVEYTPDYVWELSGSMTWRNLYTGITGRYAPRYTSLKGTVYENSEPIYLGPGEVKDVEVRFSVPVQEVFAPVLGHHADTDIWAVTAGGEDASTVVVCTFDAARFFAQHGHLTFTNTSAQDTVAIVGVKLRGIPVPGDVARQVELAASASDLAEYWPAWVDPKFKVYSVPDNPFVQTEEQIMPKVGLLRDRLARPQRVYGFRGPCCPYLELGDCIALNTPDWGILVGYLLQYNVSGKAEDMFEMNGLLLPIGDTWGLRPGLYFFELGHSALAMMDSAPVCY